MISLPKISQMSPQARAWQFHIYISDTEGFAATNNITIIAAPGDLVGGGISTVINTDNGFAEIVVSGFQTWGALSSSGGGGTSGIIQSHYFRTIAAQNNYPFDGTPTAWNPGGLIDLRNKPISFYASAGIIQNPTATPTQQYVWNQPTGTLELIGTIYNGTGMLFWQT